MGWVGKDHPRKRLHWFEEAVAGLGGDDVAAVLLGAGLGDAALRLRRSGVRCSHFPREGHAIADYPAVYRLLDCLVVTSETESGPLVLFEALASGVPVVSTPVGWAPYLAAAAPGHVRLADSPSAITAELGRARAERAALFEQRHAIAGLVAEWTLEGWVSRSIQLAASLAIEAG